MSSVADSKFYIKGGDVGFASRQKDIFDQLNAVEKEKNERQGAREPMDVGDGSASRREEVIEVSVALVRPRKRLRAETKQFRGKESIFKRPESLPPRFKTRNTPDYQRNPHKWMKYSLGDVSQEDMSDKSNTAAALAFLREIEARKTDEPMEEDHTTSQILFKPKNKSKILNCDPEVTASTSNAVSKPSFRSTKLIMPEYVVGKEEKKRSTKKQKLTLDKNDQSNKSIKLLHLMEEEDE